MRVAVWLVFLSALYGSATGSWTRFRIDNRSLLGRGLSHHRELRGLVSSSLKATLTLQNNAVLAIYPCRPAAVRGIRARVVILDEMAFFRSTEGFPVDTEMLRAPFEYGHVRRRRCPSQ